MSNWDKIALGVRPVNKLASRVAKKEDLGLDNTSEYIKKLERENLLLKQEVEVEYIRATDYIGTGFLECNETLKDARNRGELKRIDRKT